MITAAADGSSLDNPGPAGWAWYIDDRRWAAGGWPRGTNNMGELMAVLDLLRSTAEAGEDLTVLCDSQYAINCCTKWIPGWKRRGWKKRDGKPVLNRDLLEQLDVALAGRAVAFEWVKGHAGHRLNEAADTRARAAATAYRDGTPVDEGPGFGDGGDVRTAGDGQAGGLRGSRRRSGDVVDSPLEAPDPSGDTQPAGAQAGLFDLPETPLTPDQELLVELTRLEKLALSDEVRSDPSLMGELLAPDFVEHGSSGRLWTRGRMLADLAPLEVRPKFETLGLMRLSGDCVLLRWRERAGSRVVLRASIWARGGVHGWRMRFHQGTLVR
ncbi:Ribonuclease HI [Acidipropionibacterium acidipropionici ATCC 4875]|uniref:Ribonuclease H n=1 Tax=Acidipropionibacterium acidipropionici (strain ATCC 4875 / DSM 20272 / JCM 6432 / NBRC 12425 / NCIMB 8070 / 4) TaxID=1171373 RepID=K7RUY6_ACIA4|nr:RNase H family protein [Acidipropionibacterium acidipropionici]AFV90221.1 Ribonuclease HI [Acidipropionibacterium acidipropionici ATCC 4875]